MKEGDARLKCIAGVHAVLVAENWVWGQSPAPRKKKDICSKYNLEMFMCAIPASGKQRQDY